MKPPISYRTDERLTYAEYVRFLIDSDLGAQYPRQRFEERIPKLLANSSVVVTARSEGRLVGVLMAVTDFVYYMHVTDLGVVRDFERQGIGSQLIEHAIVAAGGSDDIMTTLIASEEAFAFYEKNGFKNQVAMMYRSKVEWEDFVVDESFLP